MITPAESEKLKEYCEYLLEKCIEINPCYEDSRLYYQLKEYSETGLIKDIIHRNTEYYIRVNVLSLMAKTLNEFAENKKAYTRKHKIEEIKKRFKNEDKKGICK